MFEKLKEIEVKYIELEEKLQTPEVYSDPALYGKIAKEQKEIEPVVNAYRRYKKAKSGNEEAKELLSDPEMKDIAQEEFDLTKAEMSEIEEEIKILLIPKDPNDSKNVIVEIRGGTGGDEAALFAYNLYRMYSMYAESKRWKTSIMSLNETDGGGFKE